MSDINKIRIICNKEYGVFIKKANVIGILLGEKIIDGINTKEKCIQVLVIKKVLESELSEKDKIPKNYKDVKTDVVEIGKIEASV